MADIKVFQTGEVPSPLEAKLAEETIVLPCGHSAAQAAWLGCTATQCRPDDVKISAAYKLEKAREGKR